MRRLLSCTIVILLLVGTVGAGGSSGEVTILLENGTRDEGRTRDQLQRLLDRHDLSKWIVTRRVRIDRDTIPHSRPVLTLHTRWLWSDDLLLSTFLHEQIHWHQDRHRRQMRAAIRDLREVFPEVPVGRPEGDEDEYSTYLHLVTTYLEYQAVREVLGDERARRVIEYLADDHYTWIYRQVLDHEEKIGAVVERHGLNI